MDLSNTFNAKFGSSQQVITGDHNDLSGRDAENQHPITAIEGLEEALGLKQGELIAGQGVEIIDNGDGTYTIQTSGSASGELSTELIVSNPIGKYGMDDVIPEGTSFESVFRGLLSKTYYPALSDPSLAITWAAPALAKVGASISALQATLNFNRGAINPQYTAESPYRAGEATGYSINLSGADVAYSDSGTNNKFNVPAFTRNTVGNVVLNASVNYAQGVQPKDSDGADYQTPLPAGSKSASKTVEFILPFYWGKKAAASISDFAGLTEDLTKKGQKQYRYANANNEYLYIVFDASYGNLKNIIDENNIDNIDSWQKSSLSVGGQNYNVYRSGFAITGSPSFTFKF